MRNVDLRPDHRKEHSLWLLSGHSAFDGHSALDGLISFRRFNYKPPAIVGQRPKALSGALDSLVLMKVPTSSTGNHTGSRLPGLA